MFGFPECLSIWLMLLSEENCIQLHAYSSTGIMIGIFLYKYWNTVVVFKFPVK